MPQSLVDMRSVLGLAAVGVMWGCATTSTVSNEALIDLEASLPDGIVLASHNPVSPVIRAAVDRCIEFEGALRGNDPHVTAHLVMCKEGDAVRGTLTWNSKRSGTNVRLIAGDVRGDVVRLEDVKLLYPAPRSGWRFCPIVEYDLRLDADGNLRGTYWSPECRDNATVSLTRVPSW